MTSSPLTSKVTFSSSTVGLYAATIQATNSSIVKNSNSVTVHVQNFTISASPTNIALLNAGAQATSMITIAPVQGFSGTVALSINPSAGLTASLDKSSISSGSGTSTLTVSSSAAGNYTAVVTGTVGSTSYSVTVSVNVVDFTITRSPSTIGPLPVGATGSSTITVMPANGFIGNFTVSYSSSSSLLHASLSATSITKSGGVLLTVTSTSVGNYTVTITVTSGSLTHSSNVSVRISGIDVVATPGQFTILVNSAPSSSTITVQSINGFSGTVTFTLSSPTSGLIPTLSRTSLLLQPNMSNSTMLQITVGSGLLPGSYVLDVNATQGTQVSGLQLTVSVPVPDFSVFVSQNSVLSVAGTSAATSVSVSFYNGFNGTLTLSASPASGFACSLDKTSIPAGSSTTSTLSCSGIAAGFYNVTVTGAGHWFANSSDFSRKTMVQFDNQDFTVSLAETSIVANASSPAHVKVTIGAVGTSGWSGTVTLTVTASSGLSGVLTSTTLSGTGTVNLDVTASSGGTYTVTVTAASGSLSHTSQQLTVGVPQPAPSPGTPVLLYAIVGVLVAVVVAGVIVARTRRKKTK
jgi:hypothetical protein